MSYEIKPGIPESELKPWLQDALDKYGFYQGQEVNFTHAKVAPTVMCTVVCGHEILLLKRGYGLADAEGCWSTMNGFIDEFKPVKDIVRKEAREELGLHLDPDSILVAPSYLLQTTAEKRDYFVFPCLVSLPAKPKITLNAEHTDYTWITRDQLENYDILDDLPYAVDTALKLAS